MIKRLTDIFKLCRTANCTLAAAGTWVGFYTCSGEWFTIKTALAVCVTLLSTAAGNISNDIADLHVDQTHKPSRPLAAGLISVPTAWTTAALFFIISSLLSTKISFIHLLITISAAALLFVYNFSLKKIPLAGNLVVAGLSGLPFVFGGLISDTWKWSLIPFVFSTMIHLAREFLKSLEDLTGDAEFNIHTIAYYIPKDYLLLMIKALLLSVSLCCFIPFHYKWYNACYLIICIITVVIPYFYISAKMLSARKEINFPRVHQILKISMLGGIIAVITAR